MSRGFSKQEVYDMPIVQVMFLSKVNNRLKDIETLQSIQTSIASNGRQMEDMGFTGFTNRLRYG